VVPPTRLPAVDPRELLPDPVDGADEAEPRPLLLRLFRLFDRSPKRLVLPRIAPRLDVAPPDDMDVALDVMLGEPPLELLEVLLPPLPEELPPEPPPEEDREPPPEEDEPADEPPVEPPPPPPPPPRLRPPENVPPSLRPLS
jgi:hypothetical protein